MPPPPPKQRKKDTTVCCPLVYGSMAFWLGRKADEVHTHRWTLFVRGPHGEDPSAARRRSHPPAAFPGGRRGMVLSALNLHVSMKVCELLRGGG